MFQERVVEGVQHLVSSDPAACDAAGLAALVTVSQRVRGWLDAYDTRIALRAAELATDGRSPCASEVLAARGRRCSRDAAAAARRAAVCDQLSDVHDALAAGDLSAGHVDSIARAARSLDEGGRSQLAELQPVIVAAAASSSVEEFAKDMRQLERLLSGDDGLSQQQRNHRDRKVRRWVDRNSGMCHTHLELDAETDACVAAALDSAMAAARAKPHDPDLTFDQLHADTLVDLITRPDGAAVAGRPVPEVTVLIDLETLRTGLHANGVCETGDGNPIPAESVRRKSCEAVIVPIVLDGAGVVVDEGRARRVATREQRRALRAMYATCAHPGCGVRFEACQIHHVIPWEHDGPTDLANLLPLCTAHHHLVHEGGWRLTLHPDRRIELRRPDGALHFDGSTVDRAPAGVAAQAPPAPPGASSDPQRQVPAPLPAAAARIRAEQAAAAAPPPPTRPWRHDPQCIEIPEHLIRAAQAFQAARCQQSGPRLRIDSNDQYGIAAPTVAVPSDHGDDRRSDFVEGGPADRRHGPSARAPAA